MDIGIRCRQQGYGIKDGNTGQDYWYDANGNLITDLNKGISTIAYNHLNLPKRIAKGDSTIQYVYDANGTKLQKILKKGGAVIKTTSYIGDLVYEGTTDKFLNTEEGRVVLMENGQSKEEYQYHLKDHLGNVRVTFTTADREELTNLYMATMEPEFAALEGSTFNNLDTRQVDQLHNKTEGGKASARLNAAQGKAIGPSMSLKVMAGDTVRMKVFAQYHDKAKTKDAIEGMTSMVASAFTPKGAPAEAATIVTQALRQPLGGAGRLALFAKDNTIPKAYLNYLFFDKDMNYKTGGFKQVSEEGLGQFEELSLEFAPEEEGLLMVYTTNQTAEDLDVYFDQMTVSHTSGPIVRVDDYYPFGMTFNTGELAGALTNKYLYNGKELQNELGLDWYDYGARMYDAQIGRWHVIDPLAGKYYSATPYNYVLNTPINAIDPDGTSCAGCGSIGENVTLPEWRYREIGSQANGGGDNNEPEDNNVYFGRVLPEVVVTPDDAYEPAGAVAEWDINLTWGEYQKKYPEFAGMSQLEAAHHWQQFYSEDFFAGWDASVKQAQDRINIQKMAWFIQGYTTAGMIGTGALGGLRTPGVTRFNLAPRGINIRGHLEYNSHFVSTRGPGYWARPGHGQFPRTVNSWIIQGGSMNWNAGNSTWRFSINGYRGGTFGRFDLGIRPDGGIMHSTFYP